MEKSEIEKEAYIVDEMIALYCKKNHKAANPDLCPDCAELIEYCHYRLSLCPFGEKKTFCSNCRIHCYDKKHRGRIRAVMRFSGPRMLFHHPVLAVEHVLETKREKRRIKRNEKRKQTGEK